MALDDFNPEEDDNQAQNGPQQQQGLGGSNAMSGGAVSYHGAGGGAPGGATNDGSPGFVNLSQLLSLNKGSGAQSAGSLDSSVNNQGDAAVAGIDKLSNDFNSQSDKAANIGTFDSTGMVPQVHDGRSWTDPNSSSGGPSGNLAFQSASKEAHSNIAPGTPGTWNTWNPNDIAKAQAVAAQSKYNGPQSLNDVGDVAGAGQAAQSAQDRANQMNSAAGRAAAASSAQGGLGARQAAASSFYMGNSDPRFQQTANKFSGLSSMLSGAQNAATARANANAGTQSATAKAAQAWADKANADNRDAVQNAYNADQSLTDQRNKDARLNPEAHGHKGTLHNTETTSMDDSEIAAMNGMTYAQWVAAGKPTGQAAADENRRRNNNTGT